MTCIKKHFLFCTIIIIFYTTDRVCLKQLDTFCLFLLKPKILHMFDIPLFDENVTNSPSLSENCLLSLLLSKMCFPSLLFSQSEFKTNVIKRSPEYRSVVVLQRILEKTVWYYHKSVKPDIKSRLLLYDIKAFISYPNVHNSRQELIQAKRWLSNILYFCCLLKICSQY